MRELSRRAFLSSSLALGVGAVAWACSKGKEEEDDGSAGGQISLVATGLQLAVGDSRQAMAILKGQKPYIPDELRVRLTPPGRQSFPVDVQRQKITFGQGGDVSEGTEITTIFTFRHEFDRPGIWLMAATSDGIRSQAAFQVLTTKEVESPLVGEPAIASQSPTAGRPQGVDPICTRTPVCSMHELTIADALAASKPAIVVFGTPRFCVSRTCGPVVDIVERQSKRVGDACSFVHVEVWKDDESSVNKPGGEAPAFAEWKLGTEPWIYFIDAGGKIADRWLGAVGDAELRRAVDRLVG